MDHGRIPVETLSDHGISGVLMFQVVCSLAHKEDVYGERRVIIFLFFIFTCGIQV